MDALLVWALQNEKNVFGEKLRSFAEKHSEIAFECVVQAVEVAEANHNDRKRQEQIVKRKARNLLIDRLRRMYGVTTDDFGRRILRTQEELTDEIPDRIQPDGSPDPGDIIEIGMDPKRVHEALKREHPPDIVRMFEMFVSKAGFKAIGRELGVTPEAARKRWERAREVLAETIARESSLEKDFIIRVLGGASTGRPRVARP